MKRGDVQTKGGKRVRAGEGKSLGKGGRGTATISPRLPFRVREKKKPIWVGGKAIKDYYTLTSVAIPLDLAMKVHEKAREEGISAQAVIRMALYQMFGVKDVDPTRVSSQLSLKSGAKTGNERGD